MTKNNTPLDHLTPEQYQVTQKGVTEPPFTGELLHNKEDGTYSCIVCGAELFHSDTKFDSGSGWPSFTDVMDQGKVTTVDDHSAGMHRIEVKCSNCNTHLGHLFDDGPAEGEGDTGMRYCVNSTALDFKDRQLT